MRPLSEPLRPLSEAVRPLYGPVRWQTTHSTVDLREGGTFLSRMEAKDGSAGFDFEGSYTRVVPPEAIEYRMSDGREVAIDFGEVPEGVLVKVAFDAETENRPKSSAKGGRPSWTTSAGTWWQRADSRWGSASLDSR
jgi:uncharacterized protein YndB with AHSA1/START domain